MKTDLACGAKFSSSGWDCPIFGNKPLILDGYYAFVYELVGRITCLM